MPQRCDGHKENKKFLVLNQKIIFPLLRPELALAWVLSGTPWRFNGVRVPTCPDYMVTVLVVVLTWAAFVGNLAHHYRYETKRVRYL